MFNHKGINLHKLQRDLLPKLLELKNESWESTHHITIATMDDQVRWFESLDRDVHTPRNLVLVASQTGFSNFGIFKISNVDWHARTADVAWDIFKEHRGLKLGAPLVFSGAAFCFKILNLWRLNCEILETNIASQKCADKSGFVKEGVKRKSAYKSSGHVDSGVWGALRQDFTDLDLYGILPRCQTTNQN